MTDPVTFEVRPIGWVHTDREAREDDHWGEVRSMIRLDARFGADALAGLQEFSHIDVIFVFDRFDETKVNVSARHPRGNQMWPEVGIFAQRASSRPNRLGVTTCALLGTDGLDVLVQGLDAIDGTPVLDIKPFVEEFQPRTSTRQPTWMSELMTQYW